MRSTTVSKVNHYKSYETGNHSQEAKEMSLEPEFNSNDCMRENIKHRKSKLCTSGSSASGTRQIMIMVMISGGNCFHAVFGDISVLYI